MRIYFRNMTLPKKAAKRIHAHFTLPPGLDGLSMTLSEAQELTARMLGYADWHELHRVTQRGDHQPSPLDEDAGPTEQQARIDYQTMVLGTVSPLIEPVLRKLVLTLRVSAGIRASDNFIEDAYRQNTITQWQDPTKDKPEWRFLGSVRADEISEEVWELLDFWQSGNMKLGEYLEKLKALYKQQPENMSLITDMLSATTELDALILIEDLIPEFEKEINLTIPVNFPERRTTYLSWYETENRDFHRAVALLAEAYYRLGNFSRAKRWFNFSNRTCEYFKENNIPFLKDLRARKPKGNIHLLDDEERMELAHGHLMT